MPKGTGHVQRRRFRGFVAFGIVSAIGLSAASCGGSASGGGEVTLKLVAADYGSSGADNSSKVYWDELVEDFEKEHDGITVDVTVVSWNDVSKTVNGLVDKGEAPDIAQLGAYADYADAGKLYGVSDLLSIPTQSSVIPSLAQAGELNRTQYGLPFVSSTRVLFYNEELFEEAGLDPKKPPKSWDELAEAAEALKASGVKHPYGLPLGAEEAQGEAMNWLLGGGGAYTGNVGSYTIDSEENVKTFTWLQDELVGKGLTGPGSPSTLNRQDLFDAFSEGDVGMLNGHPTLMKQADKGEIDYSTAPLPGADGVAGATMGVSDWIMGFKQNGHKDEIGSFLDFVFTDEQHYKLADRYDLLPVTHSASERMVSDAKHKDLWPFLRELSAAEFYPVNKISWAKISEQIKKTIGRAVAKGEDPEAVLGALQRKAEAAEAAARNDQ